MGSYSSHRTISRCSIRGFYWLIFTYMASTNDMMHTTQTNQQLTKIKSTHLTGKKKKEEGCLRYKMTGMCGIIYIFEGNVWNKSSSMQSKTVLATCSKLVHTAIDSNPPRPMNMDMYEAIVYISVQTTVEKNIYFCQKTHHS